MTSELEQCDCGALVPREEGPVHAYMRAAPACWRMYGELTARALERPSVEAVPPSHVDCYATQHTRGLDTDRRQRQSVAIHLIALALWLDDGIRGLALAQARGRTSEVVLRAAGMSDWPPLRAPREFGPITAADLYAAEPQQFTALVGRWPETVWDAWLEHHGIVRGWANLLLKHGTS